VGVLGRRVGGDRVGLLAAAIAAVYPLLWVNDATVLSESLYGLLIALALIAAYRVIDRPTAGRAAALGAVVALAALTRSEALALAPLLVLPVAWRARWRGIAAAALAGALLMAPWLVRNSIAFDHPVLISNNSGSLLAGANCDATYHGRFIGLWRIDCIPSGVGGNEAERAAVYRSRGIDYARDHAGRVPAVAAVRVLRTWDFWVPHDQAIYETLESRDRTVEYIGVGAYYLLLPFAITGVLLLRRRREPVWILLAPAVLVTVSSLVGYGLTRFRLAAEIPIVVLASLTLLELQRRARARRA
jgi:4-amino-4-deoxy-L-arabinose transferase-like glycosyltransferase